MINIPHTASLETIPGGWSADMQLPGMEGFTRSNRGGKLPAQRRRVMEGARLIADAINGRIEPYWVSQALQPSDQFHYRYLVERYPGLYPKGNEIGLRETMSVTDYQALFVDVLDRLYYGYYSGFPVALEAICKIKDLRDFRLVSRYMNDGMVSPAEFMDAAAPAPEQAMSGPVPQNASTAPTTNTAPIQYQPRLMQTKGSVNLRAMVNDDLGIFQDIPKRMVISINRGISIFLHAFVFGTSDLNTTLFAAGYKNRITLANGASSDNPALGAQGIMDGMKILAGMLDSSGQPIMVDGGITIVYGPSNKATAENLQNTITGQISVEGGSQNAQGFPTQFLQINPWFKEGVKWVMDPYLNAAGAVAGGFSPAIDGAWAMFVNPQTVERPAIELGYLSGFRTAQLFQKVPNTMRVGGGVEPQMGDFVTMNNDIKAITVLGGSIIDGRSCVGSNGTGS